MQFQWPEEFACGIEEIDEAQREMFDQVNQLISACQDGRCVEQIQSLLEYLQTSLVGQFETEEALMKACHYPDRCSHKAMHKDFMRRIRHLERELKDREAVGETLGTFNETVIDWLFDHVCVQDRALGDFLRTPGKKEALKKTLHFN